MLVEGNSLGHSTQRTGVAVPTVAMMAFAAIVTVALFTSGAFSQTKAPGASIEKQAPAASAGSQDTTAAPAEESQPGRHARSAGVQSCLGSVDTMARLSVSGSYTAVSTWNTQAPNDHVFNSIVAQQEGNPVAPQALSVLIASPTAQRACDSTAVEVRPSALSCEEIERPLDADKRMTKTGLSGVAMHQADPSLRFLLLPNPKGGCVVVSVRTQFPKS